MSPTHTAVPGSERVPMPGARSLGPTNPHAVIKVTLKLRRRNPLPALEVPADPPLSPQTFTARYGASQDDVDAVRAALIPFGVSIPSSNLTTRSVLVEGPVSAMEAAFDVRLFNYASDSGPYRGRVGPVRVPDAIAAIVEGVFGLDNRSGGRRRRPPVERPGQVRGTHAAAIPLSWYKPAELAARYRFPAGDGAGETIAVLEFGGGYFPSDFQTFCGLCGIANPPAVTPISVDGKPTNAKDQAEGEVMLDVEVLAGLCPAADIRVYFAQFESQGWIANLDAAIHDPQHPPGVVSVSWGWAELQWKWTVQAMKQVDQVLQDAAHLGITVCVASGDDGSGDAIADGHAHADFPCSSPYALAVGGTTIPAKGSAQPDVAWKEGSGIRDSGGGSTGGGVSNFFPRPTWQSTLAIQNVNPGGFVGRIVPDLAANADWTASPYLLAVDGRTEPNGGTSAAAPLVAGLLTLINAQRVAAGKPRVGYVTPRLYGPTAGSPAGAPTIGAQGCTDVASGSNTTASVGGYAAAVGFDAVSGWGTPIGTALAGLL